MKKYIIFGFMATVFSLSLNGQVLSNKTITNQIADENAFLDASSNFNTETGAATNNAGKGLVFPTVDLTSFEFKLTNVDGYSIFPTFFNGMVVYNRATGTTLTAGNRPSTAVAVTPGFYYFSNPNGITNFNTSSNPLDGIRGGIWKPLGGGTSALTEAGSGLTASRDTIKLGGTLTQAAQIAQAGFNFYTTGEGKVSIGAAPTAASSKFEVKGSATNTSAYNAGSGRDIDFGNSNLAYTTASAGAFALTNVKDGGTYTLAVQGTTSGTSTFTAINTAAASLTVKILNNKATVAGTQTLYTIIVMGTTAYVFVNSGF